MTKPATVLIIGAPVACAEGIKNSWREVAAWLSDKLQQRYGTVVRVQYFDLFDPGCPPLPSGAQLPLVMVDENLISQGGKVSMPVIRAHLEGMGVRPRRH